MDQQKLLTSSGELHLEIEMWDVGCGVDKYCSGESMWMIHKCFFMVWLWTFSFSLVWILSGCVLSLKDYSTPESIQRQQIFHRRDVATNLSLVFMSFTFYLWRQISLCHSHHLARRTSTSYNSCCSEAQLQQSDIMLTRALFSCPGHDLNLGLCLVFSFEDWANSIKFYFMMRELALALLLTSFYYYFS